MLAASGRFKLQAMAKKDRPHTSKADVARRIEELVTALRGHDELYYNEAAPVVSDAEYDRLKRELTDLEAAHPDLATDDSPTTRVGAPVRNRGFAKATHRVPMLSLESLTSEEEVREFAARARKLVARLDEEAAPPATKQGTSNPETAELGEAGAGEEDAATELPILRWSLEPKYDGVSASLLYEDGVYTRGLSRGDGRTGEVVTENYSRVRGVIPKLRGKSIPKLVEVRGEIMLRRDRFAELQKEQERRETAVFRNARNAVAGALKRVDPEGLEDLGMEFVAWGVGDVRGMDAITDYFELVARLEGFGFPVSPHLSSGDGVDAVIAYHHDLEARRDELPFEMDGIVAKLANFGMQRALGRTARAPRWALAYKFSPRQAWTILREIQVQVGRTGAITPVAILEPIDLSGVTVQRASLHNFALVLERDLRVGDRVLVERAGDVIPEVVQVDAEARDAKSKPFPVPESCPECGEAVHGDGPILYCSNIDCPAQIRERVVHLAARRALDIDRLGEKYVDQLFAEGLLTSVEDVFLLDTEQDRLLELERWGPKSVQALTEELERAKSPEFARFLFALGIRHVGEKISYDLAAHFGSLDALRKADVEALLEVEGVGKVVAEEIRAFFDSDRNLEFLARLEAAGVSVRSQDTKTVSADAPLAGRVFVFTGGLESLTRDQARERVEALGATTVSGVSKKVTDVVAGAGSGTKRAKAEKLGLHILEEAEFVDLLEQAAP